MRRLLAFLSDQLIVEHMHKLPSKLRRKRQKAKVSAGEIDDIASELACQILFG